MIEKDTKFRAKMEKIQKSNQIQNLNGSEGLCYIVSQGNHIYLCIDLYVMTLKLLKCTDECWNVPQCWNVPRNVEMFH